MQDFISRSLTNSFNLAINSFRKYPQSHENIGPARHFMLFPNLTKTENLHQDGYYNVKTEFFETSYNAKLNSLEFKHKKRMWKGGNIKYLKNQLKTLENVSKIKSLKSISSKNTSRGQGIFTTELREIYNQDGLAVVEERALVYLDENFKDQGRVLKRELIPDYTLTLLPTEEMLFRFSAVTFNAHKIHYSKEYANQEGYKSLLVHGPLTVSLLLDMLDSKLEIGTMIQEFDYSCTGPCYVNELLVLNLKFDGNKGHLWACNPEGSVVVKGIATLSDS